MCSRDPHKRFRNKARLLRLGSCWLLAATAALCLPVAQAGQLNMLTGGVNVKVPVKSVKERQFRKVLQQRYDYSCGSAALASLLTFHYDDQVAELEVFQSMYENGDQEKIAREGFSLLDMKQYLKRRGYESDGYRVSLDELKENQVPAIVLIDRDGYLHFVVIKGVAEDRVLVGDPALGIKVIPRQAFDNMWNGIVFLIRTARTFASNSFNQRHEWNLWTRAPLNDRSLSSSSLATFSLLQQRPSGEF